MVSMAYRLLLLSFAALFVFQCFSGCNRGTVIEIKNQYRIGSTLSELNILEERILLDLKHPPNCPIPLVVGLRGYEIPRRSLAPGERLIVLPEELGVDLVTYLFFCSDDKLCATEVLGS